MRFIAFLILFGLTNHWISPAHAADDKSMPDMDTPRYFLVLPEWGVEASSSFNAFGRKALVPDQGDTPTNAFSLSLNYQPSSIQRYGILGFGPSFTLYPIFGGLATNSLLSIFSFGGEIRYQARYFVAQPVVPMLGYEVQYINYQFINGRSGNVVGNGPILGLWVLLNFIEPSAAGSFYNDVGVARTYLILEVHNLSGSDANIQFSGSSYYVGLRFEY